MKLPGPKESAVVASCIKWLWQMGCFIWRNNSGAYKPANSNSYVVFGKKGSPDIIGLTPHGRFIGVECKRPGGKGLEPHQEAFRDKVEANNGLYILARSLDDLEAMKAEILGSMGEMG